MFPRHTDDLNRLRNKPVNMGRFQSALVNESMIRRWRWRSYTHRSVFQGVGHPLISACLAPHWFSLVHKRENQNDCDIFTLASTDVGRADHSQRLQKIIYN